MESSATTRRGDLRQELRQIPLFADLKDDELQSLAAMMQRERFIPGQYLCREGEIAWTCFFIVDGEVEVLKEIPGREARLLATARTGEVVGQVALLTPGTRSASCRARVPVTTLTLDRDNFEALFASSERFARKFQLAVARQATAQLREANRRLVILLDNAPSRFDLQRQQVLQDLQAAELPAAPPTDDDEGIDWVG